MPISILRFLSIILLISFYLQNIAANAESSPPTAPIIDGTRVPSSQYPNVTPVLLPNDGLCSGTLIAPNFVLTAAHCFFNENNQRAVGNGDVQVIFAGQVYSSSRVYIHPAYRSRSEACVEGELDGALVQLSANVPGITPALLSRDSPSRGQSLTLVGYGLEGTGSTGEQDRTPPDGFVNVGYTPIESISNSYLIWNFDRGESNTAGGDSGGPSFATISNQLVIAGITCGGGGNSEFGTDSLNTRVDKLASWIDSVAGTSPGTSAPQLIGPTTIQGRVGETLSVDLSFSGSTPTSLEVSGLPAGLNLSGNSIVGTPLRSGTYNVAILASNALGASSSDITISITAFTPQVTVRSVLLQFDFTNDGEDFLIVKGKMTLPSRFKPKGKKTVIQIGRFKKSCKLDSSGGCGDYDFFQLNGKLSKGSFTKQSLGFELQLVNKKLFPALSTLGFPDSSSASIGEVLQLPIEILINGISYTTTPNIKFRGSDERWIKTK